MMAVLEAERRAGMQELEDQWNKLHKEKESFTRRVKQQDAKARQVPGGRWTQDCFLPVQSAGEWIGYCRMTGARPQPKLVWISLRIRLL